MEAFVKIATNGVLQHPLHTRRSMRVVVWVCAAIFLLALALRDLQFDRKLVLEARMDRATPYLSTLGPPARVALSFDRVALSAEPVYVNLRIPRWFRRVTVELEYENPSELALRFGVRTHPTQWAFQFPESVDCSTPGVEQSTCLRVPFELQRAWQVERNVYRFVLSAPGVSAEQPIIVRGLRVTAERDPVCIGAFCV